MIDCNDDTILEQAPTPARLPGTGGTPSRDAVEALTRQHLPLVRWFARRYVGHGLPRSDLVAEGAIGLMKAAAKYDPACGARFCTYAGHWIERQMRLALARQGATIRIPEGMGSRLRHHRRVRAEMAAELGRDPSDGEVARRLNLAEKQVRKLRLNDVSASPLVPDDPEADARKMIENNAAPVADTPGYELMTRDSVSLLHDLIRQLGEREHYVVRLNFGLDSGEPLSLARIASDLGLSCERIRQIRQQALTRLRRLAQPHADELLRLCA